ncbi:MAG: sodium/alanine symporter [Elusimicrobia bacterium]|nr:MAG: sodium/alanine symporter [Elusimicrobiota bacterium]
MGLLEAIDKFLSTAVDLAWGWPLIALLVGGGAFLTLYSRLIPFLGSRHALDIVRGKFDDPDDPGQISHFQALTTALASTVGVGNIGGVAVAITQGGPGAVFWMWVAAIVGMATKFFTCTLASMYRREDELGVVQGGPMYYIEVGLGKKWRFLAVLFSSFGLIGCLPMFQSNQLADVLKGSYNVPPLAVGIGCSLIVGAVILGGIQRIGRFTEKLVPFMCALYIMGCLYILATRAGQIPAVLASIFHDAFTGTAAVGGFEGVTVSAVISIGVKRAAFSNEAGIGTAPMAHGAAKTKEPVREGLVAMVGPFIDTIIICSMTAFAILSTDLWHASGVQGTSLTAKVFASAMGSGGELLIAVVVCMFAISTMVGYSYYGKKCFAYLFGAQWGFVYEYFLIATLTLGAVWSTGSLVNLLDTAFALMAFPNMIAALMLSPVVMAAVHDYFKRQKLLA